MAGINRKGIGGAWQPPLGGFHALMPRESAVSRSETDSCDKGNERLPGNTGRVFAVDGKYHSTVTASAERIPDGRPFVSQHTSCRENREEGGS